MKCFVGFNNAPEAGMDRGDGLYVDINEVAAFEGLYDSAHQPFTVLHMKSGAQFRILGRAHFMLEQAQRDVAKQESAE